MSALKWILLAVGAYFAWRWWSDSQPEETTENAPLPSDTGMWDDSGGGGGGGSAGGGDYQQPENVSEPPPAAVKNASRLLGITSPLARAPRDPAPVKPARKAGTRLAPAPRPPRRKPGLRP